MAQFTNLQLVDFCKKMVGQRYWYGTCVYKCTSDLYSRKKTQYPSEYGSSRTNQYLKDIANRKICCDCVGLIKGFFWTNGGQGVIESIGKDQNYFTAKYASNGTPDESANGFFDYARSKNMEWGTIASIPNIPGLAVRCNGHVGVYIGDNKIIEARGFNYGVVETTLPSTRWTHWYKIPNLIYVKEGEIIEVPNDPAPQFNLLGSRLLKTGSTGEDVKQLQQALNLVINAGLKDDGEFGNLTFAAVKKFQAKANITVDGIYGNQSHEALMSMVADVTPTGEEEQKPQEDTSLHYVVNTDGANIYCGNDTRYKIVTIAKKGDILKPILDHANEPILTQNNWVAVESTNEIGWIKLDYVK